MSDPFSSARDAFVKTEHILGRLVLVTPTGSGERESTLPNSAGKLYTYVITDTVVLDGGVTEMIDEVPMALDGFQFSGQAVTAQLLPKVGKGMVLGRMAQKPSQTKSFGDAWVLAEPTDADKQVARNYLATATKDPFAGAEA